jgi:carboxypeptidase family protein
MTGHHWLSSLLLAATACAPTATRTSPEVDEQQRPSVDSAYAAVTSVIRDAKTGIPMISANGYLATDTWYPPNTGYGAYTDTSGRFRIDHIRPGRYILVVRHIGYQAQRRA